MHYRVLLLTLIQIGEIDNFRQQRVEPHQDGVCNVDYNVGCCGKDCGRGVRYTNE